MADYSDLNFQKSSQVNQTKLGADFYARHRFLRKRPSSLEDSMAADLAEIENLKRLKLEEDSACPSPILADKEYCQAMILRPVALSEPDFRLAICTDYPQSWLAKLINESSPLTTTVPTVPEESGSSSDSNSKQLVVYQPPSTAELLKEAAYYDEHSMELD